MKRIVIADTTSLIRDGKGFGHYTKVAKMYNEMLKGNADVIIAGGSLYSEMIDSNHIILLPFNTEVDKLSGFCNRIISKVRILINCLCLFKSVTDEIIVCQPYSFICLMIGIILKGKGKNIYLIEYKNELHGISAILYKAAKPKIKGIICPSEAVGRNYEISYMVVPDYIYYDGCVKKQSVDRNPKYDIGMVGLMSDGKDIEDIVNTYSNTNIRVLIAGYFGDKERLNRLIKQKTDNIEIIDGYLTDDEYEDFFDKVKYVVLPYKDYYKEASSGVVFDILFHRKPVITKKYQNFEFIEDYNMGILYENSLKEVGLDFVSLDQFSFYRNNINRYLNDNQKSAKKLCDYLI